MTVIITFAKETSDLWSEWAFMFEIIHAPFYKKKSLKWFLIQQKPCSVVIIQADLYVKSRFIF